MVLPAVESTPVLLMRFTPKAGPNVLNTVIDAFSQGGIIIVDSEGLHDENDSNGVGSTATSNKSSSSVEDKGPVVLGLTTTQKLLEHEAQLIRLVKPMRTSHVHIQTIMEPFSAGDARVDFINMKHDNEDDYDAEGLFTSAERALLVKSIVSAIVAPESLVDSDKKLHASFISETFEILYSSSSVGDKQPTVTLCQVLRENEYVDVIAPLHIAHIKKRILNEIYSITTAPPLRAIRCYYGEAIAFYFAWMHYMTIWFLFPGMLGLIVYIARIYRGDTVDTCDLTPFVGLATFCWAVLCNRFWDRREAELAYEWGTFALTEGGKRSLGGNRHFHGTMRRSPVTGELERFYPAWKRAIRRIVSAIITLLALAGASTIMIISMNLQGYISRADRELWGDRIHPLYFPLFAQFAEEGGIFDANSTWKIYGPLIMRAIVVANMNGQYSKLAELLSRFENHETDRGLQMSTTLKRVVFEAFDAYVVLFYLAVYEQDIFMLREELVGAFTVDTLRRVFTECVLPYTLSRYKNGTDPVGKSKKNDNMKETAANGYLQYEADLDEYEIFDDSIEMTIQFGYVTLFASAFPLAAFLALGSILIEIRSDLWKLTYVCQRAIPLRVNNIGAWNIVIKSIAWLSAFSNLLIFSFTSSQMRQWFPDYYVTDDVTGRPRPNASSAVDFLLILLFLEHLMIIIALVIRNSIPATPQSVRIELERWLWIKENMASTARSLTTRRSHNGGTT